MKTHELYSLFKSYYSKSKIVYAIKRALNYETHDIAKRPYSTNPCIAHFVLVFYLAPCFLMFDMLCMIRPMFIGMLS